MKQQLDRRKLATLLQAEEIEKLSIPELVSLFREEKGMDNFLPDGFYEIDPRNGDRIIYNSSRGRRPHDNRPMSDSVPAPAAECIICQGKTTGIIDVAELSEGFTFINKNLFPVLFPFDGEYSDQLSETTRRPAYGFHFLQWTSSIHDIDWRDLPLADGLIVMSRLAALEEKLVLGSVGRALKREKREDQAGQWGHVVITKNAGYLVGGSLKHDHQQVAFTNVMPRSFREYQRFEEKNGEVFSSFLLRNNRSQLTIKDYEPARLLVPYFMRRPYDMMLVLTDTDKQYLHQLNEQELLAVAEGWGDAIRAICSIIPAIGREIAYNVVTHNGPGAGLAFEFLPYTQETGGLEHLGLIVCQADPDQAADQLREVIGSQDLTGSTAP
jgi:galactose-1-phosphate uridylyltransferase